MRITGAILAVVLLSLAAPTVARAADSRLPDDGEIVWRYTNESPDGREALLLEEQSADAAARARQRQPFSHPELMAIVVEAALRHGLEPELLLAVAWVESGFRPYVVSPMGAQGLMQLMPSTARRVGVRNTFNPVESADGGARYLRGLLDRYDEDLTLALAAYNAGEGAVRPGRPLPPNAQTLSFVQSVLMMRDNFRSR
jgi:soluble lytic murein transglycosylase-like protein